MRDVNVVHYLIHSLGEGGDFARLDAMAARNCSAAAKSAGVAKTIHRRSRRFEHGFVAAFALAARDRLGAK